MAKAAVAQMTQQDRDAKKKAADGAPKQTLFALKKTYSDSKKNKVALFCKQQKDGSFKVWVQHQKVDSKKQRGMVTVFQKDQQPQAEAKFEELAAGLEKNGWKMAYTSAKSAFDVLPVAE